MEVLNKLLLRAKDLDLIRGLKVGWREGDEEVSHLFLVNDILVFSQPDVNSLHLRCVLLCFQVVFGLNIDLMKSEMVKLRYGN